jgi:hypothetical protein
MNGVENCMRKKSYDAASAGIVNPSGLSNVVKPADFITELVVNI